MSIITRKSKGSMLTHEELDANFRIAASGLEKIKEQTATGWRLSGKDPDNHGTIGKHALDFSESLEASEIFGALGINSVAFGKDNSASGHGSFISGGNNIAAGIASFISGYNNKAMGEMASVSGANNKAMGDLSSATGLNNESNGELSFTSGANNIANNIADSVGGLYNTTSNIHARIVASDTNNNTCTVSNVSGFDVGDTVYIQTVAFNEMTLKNTFQIISINENVITLNDMLSINQMFNISFLINTKTNGDEVNGANIISGINNAHLNNDSMFNNSSNIISGYSNTSMGACQLISGISNTSEGMANIISGLINTNLGGSFTSMNGVFNYASNESGGFSGFNTMNGFMNANINEINSTVNGFGNKQFALQHGKFVDIIDIDGDAGKLFFSSKENVNFIHPNDTLELGNFFFHVLRVLNVKVISVDSNLGIINYSLTELDADLLKQDVRIMGLVAYNKEHVGTYSGFSEMAGMMNRAGGLLLNTSGIANVSYGMMNNVNGLANTSVGIAENIQGSFNICSSTFSNVAGSGNICATPKNFTSCESPEHVDDGISFTSNADFYSNIKAGDRVIFLVSKPNTPKMAFTQGNIVDKLSNNKVAVSIYLDLSQSNVSYFALLINGDTDSLSFSNDTLDSLKQFDNNFITGVLNIATGKNQNIQGICNNSYYDMQSIIGQYNDNKELTIHEIGIGTDSDKRKNAFEVYKDGKIIAPCLTNELIDTPRSLITKEYLEANGGAGGAGGAGELIQIDDGNGPGWSLKSASREYKGDSGKDSVDLSIATYGSNKGAIAHYCFAEGMNTTANGYASHAEGERTVADGDHAPHAEGSSTTATGSASHAEGHSTTSSGWASHAEGTGTLAASSGCHAEGVETIAKNEGSHAAGTYNIGTSTDTIHETGIGTSNGRKNAFEIYKNGKLIAPELSINLITDPRSLITKEFLDNSSIDGGSF